MQKVKAKALSGLLAVIENGTSPEQIATCHFSDQDVPDHLIRHLGAAFETEQAENITMALHLLMHIHLYCSSGTMRHVDSTLRQVMCGQR